MNVNCLFKNMSTKHNKCLVDQILEHINVVSLWEPFESVYVFIYNDHSVLQNKVELILLIYVSLYIV
jgi:hypothetical protein